MNVTVVAVAVAALAAVMYPPTSHARDERMLLDIREALDSPAGRDRFDDTVQFFWGEQPYPPVRASFGIHQSMRKTFAPTKTDLDACQKAFLAALASLRDAAKAAGANAVVDIKSLYKNREFRSETQYECRAGWVVTGVTLEGRLVTLPGPGVTTVAPSF